MSLDADLATLRGVLSDWTRDTLTLRGVLSDWTRDTREWKIAPRDAETALARVEAEIARLTRNGDPDYSPDYQDEYQRLWHEARADAAAWERAAKAYASDVERMRQERNERNAEIARLREGLRRGAEGGETAEIRAWCSRLLSGETE